MADLDETVPLGADDDALFQQGVTTPPKDDEITPADQAPPPATPQPAPEPAVPAGRLREEAEARRAAERDRDEFRRQLDALLLRQPPASKPEAPKRSDLFEAPSAFVQEEIKPLLDPLEKRNAARDEHYSLKDAVREHGKEKVFAARNALQSAMGARDSEAWGVYNRAMASIDPYEEIMRWHIGKEVMTTVGSDLGAYRQKVLDEALKDPEFHKKVFEAARGTAASNGNNVNRPMVPKLPSIGKVGAAAIPDGEDNQSDEELFHAATRRR